MILWLFSVNSADLCDLVNTIYSMLLTRIFTKSCSGCNLCSIHLTFFANSILRFFNGFQKIYCLLLIMCLFSSSYFNSNFFLSLPIFSSRPSILSTFSLFASHPQNQNYVRNKRGADYLVIFKERAKYVSFVLLCSLLFI